MSEKEFFFSPVKDIVGVKTNSRKFNFSYGMAMPLARKEDYEQSLIKIEVNVVPGKVMPDANEKKKMGKFHYFNGFENAKEIFYERSFIFNQKFQYKITGIDTNNIVVTVNKNYFKFVKYRFMNIHSIGYILTDIINLRLLANRMAPLHCSGFVRNDECYVIFAPPNTGKTLTAMSLCMNNNAEYKFIAEDLAITDAEFIYAVPWTSTFRYYDSVDKSRFSRTLNNLTEKISVLELLNLGKTDPITKYVKEIVYKSKLKGIYILDRGNNSIKDIPQQEAFERINTLDRYEFNYMRAPVIIAYEYFNRNTNIEKAYETERLLLKEMISNAAFVRVVSTDDALRYATIIKDELEK